MAEGASITSRVLDALVSAGLVTAEQLVSVQETASSTGKTAGAVLAERGLVTAGDLSNVLESEMGIPVVDLSSYAPDEDALRLVPVEVARQRNVLPLFEIEGMLTVAIGDPLDVFTLDDLAQELGFEVEAVLADSASVKGAIAQYYGALEPATPTEAPPPPPVVEAMESAEEAVDEVVFDVADFFEAPVEGGSVAASEPAVPPKPAAEPGPAPETEPSPVPIVAEPMSELREEPSSGQEAATRPVSAPETIEQVVTAEAPEGPPAIDLDVLAVADAGRVAILVTEILENAVRRNATRIHILPYKSDFFLVYRVGGRLEKVSSAPLSMQAALVDGFKSFVRLSDVRPWQPALGRLKTRIAEKDLVVTVSSVPTVAGQRMVVTLSTDRPEPRTLPELGMSEAETKALHAMVERGRGILLVCAPVAGGRSSTYYALLAHAAQAGKTVYSVEETIDYEIPAVAQVLVNPGSPVGPASFFAAGMGQDTDVLAIDSVQSVEEIHLAIESAGMGKLVIATFSGGDIVSGVRRMLDLGAEPVSLAAALTLGVGQRLVRLNCPNCSVETRSPLADLIPGATPGMTVKAGSGCPNCRKTGFVGATALFEVLPFTEPVRAKIARDATGEEIAAAARAAGMRPMISSGLAKVQSGDVSPEELNRVLRFAD